MKKILLALAVCFPFFAFAAAPLQLSFDKANIHNFIGTLYGKILQKSFVLSPDVLALNRLVTLNVSLDPEMIGPFVAGFLADQGLSAVDRNGVTYIGIKSALTTPSPPLPVSIPSSRATFPLLDTPLPSFVTSARDTFQAVKTPEPLPPSFKVFKPTRSTPTVLCESVNRVFLNTCHPAAAAVVLTHSQHLEVIFDLASQLDIKPTLVDLTATFIEVTGSKRDGYGFGVVANVLGASLGLNLGATANTSTITIKGADFTALLDILRSDGRFKQVASPSGRVASGSLFNIAIGDEVPTLSGQSRDNTGQVTNQVVYRPSGVLLNVQPVAIIQNDSAMVSTTVDAQVSSFSKTESGVNGSPTLSKRQVKTSLLLADGEVAVIGGLTGSRGFSSRSSLFGFNVSNRDDEQSPDLVLLLSAQVVSPVH
jgi:type II secretory pathway component GspD/PulD (secretin)